MTECVIAHPDLPDVLGHTWDAESVEAIASSTGERLLVTDASISDEVEDSVDGVVATDGTTRGGRGALTERVHDIDFRVSGSGFWQVHPAAATTLVDAVLEGAQASPGETVLDLYAGVGLFTSFLAEAVGETGTVLSVSPIPEDRATPGATCMPCRRCGSSPRRSNGHCVTALSGEAADVVVLDPPRTGAKKAVADIAALAPRRIVYVACDPAALARDLASFAARGYQLTNLRAFALFPMTHHVECVGCPRTHPAPTLTR
ncbi:class I SAM-dependent RNA methyltransferase [Aeromicrobium sp. UC242_57]|uniref:class I SAM-dependent RNA methyltransferase n=1 Tax=Aeromicrobium sp. UC242_57 TaxID=3374624 RepID=UPI0037A77405